MNNADEIVQELRTYMHMGDSPIGKHWGVIFAKSTAKDAADLIESLQADAASYQQVKNALQREGFDDIEAMISRYKQVMYDVNERDIERDERIELLEADIARVTEERDAAVADIRSMETQRRQPFEPKPCGFCTKRDCYCSSGGSACKGFEWRGAK